jgi:para-aminobenzoate synthetase component 1
VPLVGLEPDALVRIFGRLPGSVILESGPGFSPEFGRWSVFAANPISRVWADRDGWHLDSSSPESAEAASPGHPLNRLAEWIDRLGLGGTSPVPDDDGPPFTGGLIGFYSYDLAPRIERLPRRIADDQPLPELAFGLYDRIVVYDHQSGACEAVVGDFSHSALSPRVLKQRAQEWASHVERSAHTLAAVGYATGPVQPIMSREAYESAVERALEYIRAGDIFQVNLSQQFEAPWTGNPLALYERVRAISPSPFGAFLRWPGFCVVSASPECFYTTHGDHILTRPIKGTRPRGASPDDDTRLRDELAASLKDRAELTMIVDLERNDLGRVCRYGSVRVVESHTIESFAQVHHQVATVAGQLRDGVGPVDVVRALFPGGSITGAPKIRAMQIIDELEPVRRGIYTGAIGFYGHNTSSFNIAIRTAVVANGRVTFNAGGGIVADSVPLLEYEETLHKALGLLRAIEGPQP